MTARAKASLYPPWQLVDGSVPGNRDTPAGSQDDVVQQHTDFQFTEGGLHARQIFSGEHVGVDERWPPAREERGQLGVLDEAANICQLRNLDAQYSHFRSRGIILFTVLQS